MGGMVRSVLVAWVMALTGLAAAGCGDRPEFWDEPMVFGEPVALSSGGAFLSAERNELLVVRAQAGHDLAVARYDVARAAQIIDVLADDRIVLWSREAKTLDLVDPDGRTARSWDLGAPFSGFRVSPEGRYLVAWITGTGGDDALFVNAGQLAVVDLTEEPGLGNPRLLSLKSYGDAPVGVHIAPVVEAGGGDRQPALVAWRSYVSILDLRDPEVADVSVPLRPGDETMDIWPGPMKFADAGEGLVRAWFLSTSSADLYEITIAADQLPSQGSAAVAINLFPTAPGPMDFALYRLQSGDLRVATICSSARLVITDPESS
ncbi:MAG: hypothetical protein FJ098_11435, partial [Deltaproteobacteria bacterium]|nr:hypothetical protein [Deltaproteobacteria bacterium]